MIKKIIAGIICAATVMSFAGCSSQSAESGGVVNNPSAEIEGNVEDVTLKDGDKYAVISVKDYGDITVKLFPDAAPKGVENFIQLAESGFYDGKTFHRIVSDFMIQGGKADSETNVEQFGIETDYQARHFYGAFCYANAMGNNSTQFYIVNSKVSQDLDKISIARLENNITTYEDMAKSSETGSQAEQYYNYQADYYRRLKDFVEKADDTIKAKYKEVGGTPSLDGNYTVFGQTIDGFDVLDKISAVEVEENESMNGEMSAPKTDVIIETVTIKEYKA